MAISSDLFMAILAMDAYNRGYNAGVDLDPTQLQIGNATLRQDALPQGYEAASFFAQAYTGNVQTIISPLSASCCESYAIQHDVPGQTLRQLHAAEPALCYAVEERTMSKKLFESPSKMRDAKFKLGEVVRHRKFPFRGVIFDIDPVFNNTDEWWQSIPENVRPSKDQPFYHLFAENADTEYVAYVSEQNLLPDTSGEPVRHPQVAEVFVRDDSGKYRPRNAVLN